MHAGSIRWRRVQWARWIKIEAVLLQSELALYL